MKLCRGCKTEKSLDEFYGDSSKRDGKSTRCKSCKDVVSSVYAKKHPVKRKEIHKRWRKNNPEKLKQRVYAWRKENSEKYKAIRKKYREKTKESRSKSFKEWRENNKEYLKVSYKEWSLKNWALKTFLQNKRRADTLKRTPAYADLEKIKQFYIEAERLTEETGIQHHVDHIIPLRGEVVSGFHHENNLQILTAIDNLKKSNKLITVEA